jgi:hypothetical protein
MCELVGTLQRRMFESFFTFEAKLFEDHKEELDQFGYFEDDL